MLDRVSSNVGGCVPATVGEGTYEQVGRPARERLVGLLGKWQGGREESEARSQKGPFRKFRVACEDDHLQKAPLATKQAYLGFSTHHCLVHWRGLTDGDSMRTGHDHS